jgi:hypothetical protein
MGAWEETIPHIRVDRCSVSPLFALILLALAWPPSALAQELSAEAQAAGPEQQMTDDERFSLLPQRAPSTMAIAG